MLAADASSSDSLSNGNTSNHSGPRMTKLEAIFEKAMEKCFSTWEFPQIQSLFPTIMNSQKLKDAFESMISFLRTSALKDFHEVIDQYELRTKLNALDELLQSEIDSNNETAKPPSPISLSESFFKVLESEEIPMSRESFLKLQEELITENSKLELSIAESREQLLQESRKIEAVLDQFNSCRAVLEKFDQENLSMKGSKLVQEMIHNENSPILDIPSPMFN